MADFDSVVDAFKRAAGLRLNKDAASELGIAEPAFSKARKRGSIPYDELRAWCEREGKSLDELLGLAPQGLKEGEWQLVEAYRQAEPGVRAAFDALVKAVAGADPPAEGSGAEGGDATAAGGGGG